MRRSVCRRVLAASAFAAAVAVAALSAEPQDPQQSAPQPTPQRPVFRAGANFVAVDAYPTHDGRIVEDLTRDDFEVYEDGKRQSVEEFAFVRGVPDGPDAEPIPTKLEAAGRLVGDPRRRVFVVFLTGYHATPEGAMNTRRATEMFFAQSVGTSDLFGILRPEQPVSDLVLGERAEILADQASGYWDWASLPHPPGFARSPAEQAEYDCLFGHQGAGDIEKLMDAWRLDKLLTALDEITVRLASMREARSNILLFTGAFGLPNVSSRMGGGGLPAITAAGRAAETACDHEWLRLQTARLADRFQNIIDTAQRGDVSISVVDPAGLSIYDQNMSATRGVLMTDSLGRYNTADRLAGSTGGEAIVGATEIGPALVKLAGGQSGHYELGYYSSNNKFDGKFRSISVKVRRSGVSVVARKGYQAPTAEMLRASEEAAARVGTEPPPPPPAAVAVAELGRLDEEAGLYAQAARRGDRIVAVVEIATTQMELGRWSSGAAVDARLLGPNNAEVATAHGSIAAGARAVSLDLAVPAGARGPLSVSVRATGGGELSDRIDVPSATWTLLGDPLIFRAATLPNAPLYPVADFTFRRTERVRIEWPILAPLAGRNARLLDPRGQPIALPVTLAESTDNGVSRLSAEVVLNALAPADYVVEVTADGGGGKTEQRLVPFKVVR
jgi:VWFA-related protein